MLKGIFFILIFLNCFKTTPQPVQATGYSLKTGDILFQDLDCGALCHAIESVTAGYKGMPLSHIAIVTITGNSIEVIEAIGSNVHKTPIGIFLSRSTDSSGKPKVIAGRLVPAYTGLIPKALDFCSSQLGKPYDEAFIPGNGKYYCSELLYEAFKYANEGKDFFSLYPMTFKDKATKEFFPAWVAYFDNLHTNIPEGVPGCNPAGIANDSKIEMIVNLYQQ